MSESTGKRCPKCDTPKPLDQFARDRSKASGRMSWCKACSNAARASRPKKPQPYSPERYAQWRKDNPDGLWAQWLKRAHRLTPGQWLAMWDEQAGLCYLGGHPLPDSRSKVVVDHDHGCCPPHRSCDRCRRGLACSDCNTGIGLFMDDPVLLRIVADNLERVKKMNA